MFEDEAEQRCELLGLYTSLEAELKRNSNFKLYSTYDIRGYLEIKGY